MKSASAVARLGKMRSSFGEPLAMLGCSSHSLCGVRDVSYPVEGPALLVSQFEPQNPWLT